MRRAPIGSPLPSVTRSAPKVENPLSRTDRFISESRTYSVVFPGSLVLFLTPKGPPDAERLA